MLIESLSDATSCSLLNVKNTLASWRKELTKENEMLFFRWFVLMLRFIDSVGFVEEFSFSFYHVSP